MWNPIAPSTIIIICVESYYTEIPATKAILDLPGEPGLYFCMKTYFLYHLYCGTSKYYIKQENFYH